MLSMPLKAARLRFRLSLSYLTIFSGSYACLMKYSPPAAATVSRSLSPPYAACSDTNACCNSYSERKFNKNISYFCLNFNGSFYIFDNNGYAFIFEVVNILSKECSRVVGRGFVPRPDHIKDHHKKLYKLPPC